MSKYFKNLAPGSIVHRNGKSPVNLSVLPSDKTSKKLYLEGFKYIGLKPEAVEVFKNCPKPILQKLIALKKSEKKSGEVKILKSILEPKVEDIQDESE